MSSPRSTPSRRIVQQLSVPLVGLATVLVAAGVVSGGVIYLDRSPIRVGHTAGTAAWWPHVVLFALAVALLIGARLRRRRAHPARDSRLLLLAPLGKPAARRTRRTLLAARRNPAGLVRLAVATVPAVLLLYSFYRTGQQVVGGLDPNFTANAWGGPSYAGAMACHYLDLGLLMAASGWLLDRTLLPDYVDGERAEGRYGDRVGLHPS